MLKNKILILSFCVFAGIAPAKAQFDSLNFSINGKNFIENNNASWLNALNINSKSIAEINSKLSKNGFRNYNQPEKNAFFAANVESFYKFSQKISGYGKISYSNSNGKNAHGSAFINPEENPFDIVEQADTNSGTKKLETYKILGAISVETYKNLNVGVKFDYTSANYAKLKDLRHQNNLMDLSLSVGANYNLDFIKTGANYIYRRRNESIKFSTFGTADKTYNSIISYGVFWGQREEFGAEGFTDKSREMPLFDQYNGFNYQLEIDITPKLKWFNDFEMLWRNGRYGRKGQYTIEYEKHNGNYKKLNGSIFYTQNKITQSVNYCLSTFNIKNYRNIFTSETFDGGLTNYIYHDKILMSEKQTDNIKINYNLLVFSNLKQQNQIWDFNVELIFNNRNTVAAKYPYFRKQDLKTKQLSVTLRQTNFTAKNKEIAFQIGGMLKKGSGNPYIDGWYTTPNNRQTSPAESTVCIFEEYEFLCKPQINLNFETKLAQKMFSENIKGYVSIFYNYTKAKNTIYLKDNSHLLSMTIGIEF